MRLLIFMSFVISLIERGQGNVSKEVATHGCTVGEETVENYIIKKCKDVGDGTTTNVVVGCSTNISSIGVRIEIGDFYETSDFKFTCHYNDNKEILIYEPIECISKDGYLMQPGTEHTSADGKTTKCTKKTSGLGMTYKIALVCTDYSGNNHSVGSTWTESDMIFIKPPMTGVVYTCVQSGSAQVQMQTKACAITNETIAINTTGTLSNGNYKCADIGGNVMLQKVLLYCEGSDGQHHSVGEIWDDKYLSMRFNCYSSNGDIPEVVASGCLIGPNKAVFLARNQLSKDNGRFYYCMPQGQYMIALIIDGKQAQCPGPNGTNVDVGTTWVKNNVQYECMYTHPLAHINATGCSIHEKTIEIGQAVYQEKYNYSYYCQSIGKGMCQLINITYQQYLDWQANQTIPGDQGVATAISGNGENINLTKTTPLSTKVHTIGTNKSISTTQPATSNDTVAIIIPGRKAELRHNKTNSGPKIKQS